MAASNGMHSYGSGLWVGAFNAGNPGSVAGIGPAGFALLAEMIDGNGVDVKPSVTRVTHLRSDGKAQEKVPGFKDSNQFTARFNYSLAVMSALNNLIPGNPGALDTVAASWARKRWLVELPDTGAWVFTGFLAGVPITVPEDDRLTIDVTIEISGLPQWLDLV